MQVIADIGPVRVGPVRNLELKKGVRYEVTEDIYQYLLSRNVLVGV